MLVIADIRTKRQKRIFSRISFSLLGLTLAALVSQSEVALSEEIAIPIVAPSDYFLYNDPAEKIEDVLGGDPTEEVAPNLVDCRDVMQTIYSLSVKIGEQCRSDILDSWYEEGESYCWRAEIVCFPGANEVRSEIFCRECN